MGLMGFSGHLDVAFLDPISHLPVKHSCCMYRTELSTRGQCVTDVFSESLYAEQSVLFMLVVKKAPFW